MTDEELDLVWWRQLGEILGWRIIGLTSCVYATYADSDGGTIQLSAKQRNDILDALGES